MPGYDLRLGPGPYLGGFPSLGPAPQTGPTTAQHPELAAFNQQLQSAGFHALPQPRQMSAWEKIRSIMQGTQTGQERQVQLGSY
jgi:hypothetical protein